MDKLYGERHRMDPRERACLELMNYAFKHQLGDLDVDEKLLRYQKEVKPIIDVLAPAFAGLVQRIIVLERRLAKLEGTR